MTVSTFMSKFTLGQRVHVDGDTSAAMICIGFAFYSSGCQVQVSHFVNGDLKEPWVAEWRLKAVDA